MQLTRGLLLFGLATAGCASAGRVDTATLPPGLFSSTDVDEAALYEASMTVGLGGTRPTTVQNWARALAEVDYIAGAFNTRTRWIGLDALAQEDLLIARQEVRDVIGIPRDTPSQQVVDALLAASRTTDQAQLQSAFSSGIFTLGSSGTIARLQNMPAFFTTPYAIARTNKAVYGGISRLTF